MISFLLALAEAESGILAGCRGASDLLLLLASRQRANRFSGGNLLNGGGAVLILVDNNVPIAR
jgi:hypothetical protein